ncbi:MAG: hypothetical protein GY862_29265 [Gammaproteobacteria bacterium]|nr:hypothetical protein [Gammaproteobacteria bacterium]
MSIDTHTVSDIREEMVKLIPIVEPLRRRGYPDIHGNVAIGHGFILHDTEIKRDDLVLVLSAMKQFVSYDNQGRPLDGEFVYNSFVIAIEKLRNGSTGITLFPNYDGKTADSLDIASMIIHGIDLSVYIAYQYMTPAEQTQFENDPATIASWYDNVDQADEWPFGLYNEFGSETNKMIIRHIIQPEGQYWPFYLLGDGLLGKLQRTIGQGTLSANSKEFAALMSAYYQDSRYITGNPELINALQKGNRPEAWYQLRYKSWYDILKPTKAVGMDKADNEVIMRRYFESDYFGLYNAEAGGKLKKSDLKKEKRYIACTRNTGMILPNMKMVLAQRAA